VPATGISLKELAAKLGLKLQFLKRKLGKYYFCIDGS
jgi:hypothetical protein